jgi:hypothetical protein
VILGDVASATITGKVLKTVQADRWLGGAITATSLSTLTISGNSDNGISGDADLDLTLKGSSSTKIALATATISGDLSGGTWIVSKPATTVSVGGDVGSEFVGSFKVSLGTFKTGGQFTGELLSPTVNKFTAGSIDGAMLILGGSLGADGVLGNDDPFGPGTLGTFSVSGDVSNSSIFVGLSPVNEFFFDSDDQFFGGTIKSISIGGELSPDSLFVAGQFPASVNIGDESISPGDDDRFQVLS